MTTAALNPNNPALGIERSPGLWSLAWKRLKADRIAVLSMVIVIAFLLLSLGAFFGLIAKDWNREIAINYAPPTLFKDSHKPAADGGSDNGERGHAAVNRAEHGVTEVAGRCADCEPLANRSGRVLSFQF